MRSGYSLIEVVETVRQRQSTVMDRAMTRLGEEEDGVGYGSGAATLCKGEGVFKVAVERGRR